MSKKTTDEDFPPLYEKQRVGTERRVRVRLTPGTYDRSRDGWVILHEEVDVDRVDVLSVEHAGTPYPTVWWKQSHYDWDTAEVAPPPPPPAPPFLSRLFDWVWQLLGGRPKLALPPARTVKREPREDD